MKKINENEIIDSILFESYSKIDELKHFSEQEKDNFKRLLSVFAEKIIFALGNPYEDIFSQIANATKPEAKQ